MRVLDAEGEIIELKDDEEDYAPVYRDETYASDDQEIENQGYSIEDVPEEPAEAFDPVAAMRGFEAFLSDEEE